MLVSQPPRLDSPAHAQQESSSGDEEQTSPRFFAVDQSTNNLGRKGEIFCILLYTTMHRSNSRGGVKFHSPITCFNKKILHNDFLLTLNTKESKSNSVTYKDLITKHFIKKSYFTADHQDPDRRKCCVLLLMGATQLFQHCRPLCSDHWGSRNPGLFLRYLLGMMLQVYCLMKLLKLYNCNSFLETMLVVWTSLINAPDCNDWFSGDYADLLHDISLLCHEFSLLQSHHVGGNNKHYSEIFRKNSIKVNQKQTPIDFFFTKKNILKN